jgi:hypothetical protein
MKNIIYAPKPFTGKNVMQPLIFLAGSIDMGESEEWQDKIAKEFNTFSVTFLNPRRKDWDSSWKQVIEHDKFREQVEWELNGLEAADIIFLYFEEKSKAPISLLELGLFARSGKKLIVYCPDKFWRKGNVDIVCNKYGVVCLNDLDKAKAVLEAHIIVAGGKRV